MRLLGSKRSGLLNRRGHKDQKIMHSEQKKLLRKSHWWLLRSASAVAVGAVVLSEAQGLAEVAPQIFNMVMFDDTLASDNYSPAIVRIFSGKDLGDTIAIDPEVPHPLFKVSKVQIFTLL